MRKLRLCKDCGTDNVIHKNTQDRNLNIVETMLCSSCLQSRAQLQQMKEDKLSFPKLLAKLQAETMKRVHSEIQSVSGLDRLRHGSYKGISGWTTVHSTLANYWIEQLAEVKS